MKGYFSLCRKKDPDIGKKDVFPIGKTGRWGQILIKSNNVVWIVVHSVEDARVALGRLPRDMEPQSISFCVPAELARRVWGIPSLDNFKPLFQMISWKSLKKVFIWMASPCQLIDALPSCLENVIVWVCPCSNHEEEVWRQSFEYIFGQPMLQFEVCHIISGSDLVKDGCLKALHHSPWATARFKEFRILDGTITFEDVKSFHRDVLQHLEQVSFKFDRTVITEVGSVNELARVMDDTCFIAVAIKLSKDTKCKENECNNVIASKWETTDSTKETADTYLKILAATTRLNHADYNLPQCRSDETVEHMILLVDRVVTHFKTLPSKHPLVKLYVRLRIPSVKDHISKKAEEGVFNVKWSRNEYVGIAELHLHFN